MRKRIPNRENRLLKPNGPLSGPYQVLIFLDTKRRHNGSEMFYYMGETGLHYSGTYGSIGNLGQSSRFTICDYDYYQVSSLLRMPSTIVGEQGRRDIVLVSGRPTETTILNTSTVALDSRGLPNVRLISFWDDLYLTLFYPLEEG